MKTKKPIFWFYLLAIYVILQFIWWGLLIVRLTADKFQYSQNLNNKIWMVIGEGMVFLVILFIGIWQVRKAFIKEMQLSKQQNNFLLSVSHELKTPIASLKLYLQTLSNRKLVEEKKEEILSNSIQDVDRLGNLIDNILTASRMEYRNFEVFKEDFNLSEFIQRRIQQLQLSIGKDHPTSVLIDPDIKVFSDKSAITSIVNNIYENAVKYSAKNSKISVHLSNKENVAELIIQDEGIGIKTLDKNLMFNKFYREGDEEVRKTKGTGLGLFIVKEYLILLGGEIKIDSNNDEPKGTTVSLSIPLYKSK